MISGDTIVAVSSAAGAAARMVVRISGPRAHAMAGAVCGGYAGPAGSAALARVCVQGLRTGAWVYWLSSPRSYTGEDLIELHLPGNPLLVRMVVDELLGRGARAAEAGEFTARAYFNGRLDLTEAEGIAATIAAHGEAELRAARQLMAGELARRLRPMIDELADTLALVETGIDFSEEDVTFLPAAEVVDRAARLGRELQRLVGESARFERLSHEAKIVLAGRPNSGKSTLLNALAGTERAVVSDVAGTTRDVLTVEMALDRGLATLVDAAGLEENLPPPEDRSPQAGIARQMHQRALAAVESADVLVLLHGADDGRPHLPLPRKADLVVLTKLDLAGGRPWPADADLSISAQAGDGMDELRRRLSELAFGQSAAAPALALNSRHLEAIAEAGHALRQIEAASGQGPEVLALELREALNALGRIVGQISPEDVLGRVFARFCIGK